MSHQQTLIPSERHDSNRDTEHIQSTQKWSKTYISGKILWKYGNIRTLYYHYMAFQANNELTDKARKNENTENIDIDPQLRKNAICKSVDQVCTVSALLSIFSECEFLVTSYDYDKT